MNGYLQRLVDTAAPSVGAPPASLLSPVVRSDSPLFAADQLLARDGLAERAPMPHPTHDIAGRADAGPESLVTPPGGTRAAPPARRSAPPAQPDFASTLVSGVIDAPDLGALAPPLPAWPEPVADEPDMATAGNSVQAPDTIRESAHPPLHPTSTTAPTADVATRHVPAPSLPATGVLPVASEPPPRPATRQLLDADAGPRADAPHATRSQTSSIARRDDAAAPRHALAAPLAATAAAEDPPAPAPHAEVLPRIPPLPETRSPTFAPRHGPNAGNDTPRITIGRVTVEVVPEPAVEPARPAPAQPLTAASASCIGPIGNLRAARRLYALRRS